MLSCAHLVPRSAEFGYTDMYDIGNKATTSERRLGVYTRYDTVLLPLYYIRVARPCTYVEEPESTLCFAKPCSTRSSMYISNSSQLDHI